MPAYKIQRSHSKRIYKKVKNNFIALSIFLVVLVSPLLTLAQTPGPAQSESEGSAVKEFFRTLLFCGPGNKMCDKDYNPNSQNAMIESPEQLINFFNQVDSYLNDRRDSSAQQKRTTTSVPFVASKSSIAVTASPPDKFSPPLDNDAFQRVLKSNSSLGSTIQAYIQKKPESIPSLKLYAEGGDPFAQLFLGLAYADDWTGIQNQAESCRWIKQAGSAGVSSARYFIAQRAYIKSPCFSVMPTLEQAKIWAELAALSSDQSIKQDSQELILSILKAQIAVNK
jgi:TPR repeat protein